MTFTTAHFHATTAQFVINCTLKYALLIAVQGNRSWCQSKAYVRLPISQIVTLAVSPTVFEILTFEARKCLVFNPTPPLFDAPLGDPLEFRDETQLTLQKLEGWGYRVVELEIS